MTRKTVAGSFLAVLVAATVVVAGNFWDDKPYQEWNQLQVQTIITHSPWSQSVEVGGVTPGFDWGGLSRPEPGSVPVGGATGAGRPAPAPATSPGAEPPRTGSVGEDVVGGRQSARPGATRYFLIWSSALTVRRALGRNLILQGKAAPEQVEASLSEPPENYAVTIIGADLSAFARLKGEELKNSSYLKPKKHKKEVRPLEVRIERRGPREQVASVTFLFPRQTPAGDPLIQPGEKKVEFGCNLKQVDLKIKTSFDPRKMKLRGEPDL